MSLAASSTPGAPLLRVDNLRQWFGGGWLQGGGHLIRAVEDVTFEMARGEVLGLVGESGSGKSTLGRAVLRATEPTQGRIIFDGLDITTLSRRRLRPLRARMQMIFQDPFASLNPRMTVGQIIETPLKIQRRGLKCDEVTARVAEALRTVGLDESHADRYPHEFSGGQRQRIGIARAFVMEPTFLVADEPVSALDVSIQAQVVNLLMEIKQKLDLTILFISHDLALVGHICDRVAVMYLGRIVEIAEKTELFARPRHPYTQALLASVPVADPRAKRLTPALDGDVPSPINPPSGCAFHTRCRYVMDRCRTETPTLAQAGTQHQVTCWLNDGTGRAQT